MARIKKIGGYYDFDRDGFLINPTSTSKIQNFIKPILLEVVEIYKTELNAKLHSVYIRGSIPKGQFVKNISDIDSFALTNQKNDSWNNLANFTNHSKKILDKYSFVTRIDLKTNSNHINFIKENPYLAYVLKTQSLCIFGIDVIKTIPKVKVNEFLLLNNQSYNEIFLKIKYCIKHKIEDRRLFVYFLKLNIKTAFEIVAIENNIFTTDLYFCYEAFSIYYPQKANFIKNMLYLYLNPKKIQLDLFKENKNNFDWINKKRVSLFSKYL